MLPICMMLKDPCALWEWKREKKWLKKVHSCAIISSTAMKRTVGSFFVWITSFSINPGLPIPCCCSISHVSSPNFVLAALKTNLLSDVAVHGDGCFWREQRQWVCSKHWLLELNTFSLHIDLAVTPLQQWNYSYADINLMKLFLLVFFSAHDPRVAIAPFPTS